MALKGSSNAEKIWNFFISEIKNPYGVAGILGNMEAESGLNSNNLQNNGNAKLKMTDVEFTAAVDNGTYSKDTFINDKYGYGLVQWTYPSLKRDLYEYWKSYGGSIGGLEMQCKFLLKELREDFKSVYKTLENATSVLQASNAVLLDFERPADQSVSMQNKRASFGQKYYDKYATKNNTNKDVDLNKMSEEELRNKVVDIAISFLGCKESNGTHKKIIDIYNNCKPIPAGYKVKYTDAWCATYVSAVGVQAGLHDVILRECSCQRMIKLYQEAGRWIEDDKYTPRKGDVIFYDWQDNGIGDNIGVSDHVGLVASVNGVDMQIIEGNISDSVGYRKIKVNSKYIRGYGIPDYAGKSDVIENGKENNIKPTTPVVSTKPKPTVNNLKYNIGDIVNFTGNVHYVSSNSTSSKSCKSGTAKVTARSKNAKHQYHLVAVKGKGSSVYGWVNESDISGKVSMTATNGSGTNTNVNVNAKVEYAKSFDRTLNGEYKTTANVNMRSGAGTSKTIITVIPNGSKVDCYGYYTNVDGTRWYYVQYKNSKGVRYIGFVSSKYLRR